MQSEIDRYSLDGTGFSLRSQVDSIKKDYKEVLREDTVAEKLRSDLEGLWFEYLARSPVLPFDIEVHGQDLICPKYANIPLTDITNRNEREGAVYEGIQKLERILTSVDKGFVYIISPPGWSGLISNGREVLYTTSQIYCYQKSDGFVKAFTIVCDIPFSDCEEVFFNLNDDVTKKKHFALQERIKTMVSTPIVSNLAPHNLVELLVESKLLEIKDSREILRLIETGPEIETTVSLKITECVRMVQNLLSSKTPDFVKIQETIGQAVLDITYLTKHGIVPNSQAHYYKAYEELLSESGCNGGGTAMNEENSKEYSFDNLGLCILGAECVSHHKGFVQHLGPCMICKACDQKLRGVETEKMKEDISQGMDVSPIFTFFALIFVSGFSKKH